MPRDIDESTLVRLDRLVQVGRFVSAFAHEINNCLQVIAGLAELAIDEPGLPSPVAGKLERVLAQANKGGGSVRGLLAFARERTSAVGRTDLADLAEGVLALREYPLGRLRAGVRLDRQPGRRSEVVGSPLELEQMILALVLNAERALAGVPGKRQLTVACEGDDEQVRVHVTDNGAGIAPDVRAAMFEPFVTGFADEDYPGLGLAAARVIATRYGGEIGAADGPDGGTTISVRFPRAV
jgi:two-component system C4-dicarboxylate transport sensor histidine kinase DctB